MKRRLALIAGKAVRIVVIALSLCVALPVSAAAPNEIDFDDFNWSLFAAYVSSNPRLILRYCNEARAKAARVTPNKAWTGLVMECLGHAEHTLKHKRAACRYNARAAAAFRKARPAPYERTWMADAMARTTQTSAALGCKDTRKAAGSPAASRSRAPIS